MLREIDWRQVAAIVRVAILIDFRDSRGMQGGRTSAAGEAAKSGAGLILALAMYGVFSAAIAVSLLRASALLAATVSIGFSMVIVTLMTLTEFSTVVLNPVDHGVLAHRPISAATYFVARAASLAFYVLLFTAALDAVPAAVALRYGVRLAFAFLPAAFLANLCGAMLVLELYGLIARFLKRGAVRRIMGLLQFFAVMGTIAAYQLGIRGAMTLEHADLSRHGPWVFALPPAWFAGLACFAGGEAVPYVLPLLALGALFLLPLPLRQISLGYSEYLAEVVVESADDASERPAGVRPGRLARLLGAGLGEGQERAAFELLLAYARRDRGLRLRMFTGLAIPAACVIPSLIGGTRDETFRRVMLLMCAYMVGITGAVSLSWTSISEHAAAAWIYKVASAPDAAALRRGAEAWTRRCVILPLYAAYFIAIMAWKGPATAAFALLPGYLVGLAGFPIASALNGSLPLSRELGAKGRQSAQLAIAMGLMVLALPIVAVQVTCFAQPAAMWGLIGVLGLLAGVAPFVARRLAPRLGEDPLEPEG